MSHDRSIPGLAPIGRSIGEHFAAIAAARRDSLAFQGPDVAFSYEELNALTNRLAHRLLAEPLSDDQPIAILADGGVHQVIAVLAALKAGRIYLVIDPANPRERIAAILQHAGAEVLVVDAGNVARLTALKPRPRQMIRIDADLSGEPSADPRVEVDPEAPALILYTSGSTGRHKGVVHTQRSIIGNFMRHVDAFRTTQDDRQTLLYQLSVYGGTRDLFNALLSGASLHYYPVREAGVAGLTSWITAERISIYCSVASVLRELAAALPPSLTFPDLRLVKIGGEATHTRDVERFRPHLPPRALIHCGLSSSESGLVCNYFIEPDSQLADGTVPLGRPAEGVEVTIADEAGRDVSAGTVGEVRVSSSSLAQGYWRDEAATAAAFVQSADAGARVYRTGDLALRRPDGCLEHRGRADFQVKIRGNRVDLTEIERHLLEHAECRQVAVMSRPGKSGAERLVAYVAAEVGAHPSVSALRGFLAERVPPYMIPGVFMLLVSLPRTGNGKIDRAALPDPGPDRPALSVPYVAPSSAIEADLCALWGELLGVDAVGTADDFFDLGGHSLLAAQVIARFRDLRGVPLSVRNLLDNPTVAALSAVAERLTRSAAQDCESRLAPIGRSAFSARSGATPASKQPSHSDD